MRYIGINPNPTPMTHSTLDTPSPKAETLTFVRAFARLCAKDGNNEAFARSVAMTAATAKTLN